MIQLNYTIVSHGSPLKVPYSECARRAHPDSFADILAEEIVLYALSRDPFSRADVAVSIGYSGARKRDVITINGNITAAMEISGYGLHGIAGQLARKLGYSDKAGFDPDNFVLNCNLNRQSPEIGSYANNNVAADSRPCYGHACNETGLYLPKSTVSAREIRDALDDSSYCGNEMLGPDGKVQVCASYKRRIPVLDKVVIQAQRANGRENGFDEHITGLVKPFTGSAEVIVRSFESGGPRSDKGHSGTKSLLYGEAVANGGGSLYGLDPTKPEWYGTALARQIAKSIVANGIAVSCKTHIAWIMGRELPDIFIEYGPSRRNSLVKNACAQLLEKVPLAPGEAIESYQLREPVILRSIIQDGFIGNEILPWEKPIEL